MGKYQRCLFPNARYSIWAYSKSQLGETLWVCWRPYFGVPITNLEFQNMVPVVVVKKNKATPEEVEVQMAQYHHNGKQELAEASIIVREHTPATNLFTCLWFNEAVCFTSQDRGVNAHQYVFSSAPEWILK